MWSPTSLGISIISFSSIIGTPVGITSASFNLVFSLTRDILNKLLKKIKNKKKKHNEVAMLAKNELNNIETLISQALTDSEISHKEFKVIVDEKEEYGKMKENIRMMKSKKKNDAEKDELNEEEGEKIENNKIIRENNRNA